MTTDIDNKVAEIMDALHQGTYDSYTEKERLEGLINTLFQPMIEAQNVRLSNLGRQLYAVTHEGLDKPKYTSKDTLPLLRASKTRLTECLVNLHDLEILSKALGVDKVIEAFNEKTRKDVHRLTEEIEANRGTLDNLLIKLLASIMFENTMEMLDENKLPVSINHDIAMYISSHMKGGVPDYTQMGRSVADAIKEEIKPMRPVNIVTSMLYWSQDTTEMRKSQKARGIQKIGMRRIHPDTSHDLWLKEQSLFVSLEEASEVNIGELLQSISVCFKTNSSSVFKSGLFIRTCPASPRPGALENVRAHTPIELRDGLRYLAEKMLDKGHSDYDPEGCLCIMRFIRPSCSGVLVKGHDTIVVGPTNDGVTAGGGSNIYLTLSKSCASKISDHITDMELGDGMAHHELEFVWAQRPALSMAGHIKSVMQDAKTTYESRPIITQIRGLHERKEPLVPPPIIDGEPMDIRGNVPQGSIIQETFVDVGAGDLKDCIELEQMAEAGQVPEGLVVYAPSASPNAHVGGVGIQWGIPVIYCPALPNGTTWTEIRGWVTHLVDVEPQPWEATSVKEYYGMGLQDGDRFWQYQNQALSQFLHSYMSGPKNDARFEAYLAGVYSMWILKATLAVSIGEGRHAYLNAKARFAPIHGVIHIFTTSAIQSAQVQQTQEWKARGWYYNLLRNTEIGLGNMIDFLGAYKRIFTEPAWAGSYGGKKYAESVQKGLDAAIAMEAFQCGDGTLEEVLGKVNILENAVHNCSFFFNKFISDKKFFDIGTHNHGDLKRLEWQYLVTAGFHYRFYRHCVEEPEKISQEMAVLYDPLFSNHSEIQPAYQDAIPDAYEAMEGISTTDTICGVIEQPMVSEAMTKFMNASGNYGYCSDCDSNECGCVDGAADYHHEGDCGWSGCSKSVCKEKSVLQVHDLLPKDISGLRDLFQTMPSLPNNQNMHLYSGHYGAATFKNGKDLVKSEDLEVDAIYQDKWAELIFQNQIKVQQKNVSDAMATVFTDSTREIVNSEQPYEITSEDWFEHLGLPPVLLYKRKGFNDIVYAQPVFIELMKRLESTLVSLSTATLIRDLKQIRRFALGGPVDYEWMNIMGEVLEVLSVDNLEIIHGHSSMLASMFQTTLKCHKGDIRYDEIKNHDGKMVYCVEIYTSALIRVIEGRMDASIGNNPSHGLSSSLGLMTDMQIFEILLCEFDIEFVKEVIQ
jgi:hypothetical protein